MTVGEWDSILVAINIHFYDPSNPLNWDVKKSSRRMGRAERVARPDNIRGEVGSIHP